ncbi:MAG TPA: hypothetical protein VE776_04825 [Actinomycetota bacterium]|jgi:hypothetical protein|nr:hypothetical protein [Actinomycetota bacterium]
MRHDPERAAAAYLAGELGPRQPSLLVGADRAEVLAAARRLGLR